VLRGSLGAVCNGGYCSSMLCEQSKPVGSGRWSEARLKVDTATLGLLYLGIEGLSNSDLDLRGIGERCLESGKATENTGKTLERRSP